MMGFLSSVFKYLKVRCLNLISWTGFLHSQWRQIGTSSVRFISHILQLILRRADSPKSQAPASLLWFWGQIGNLLRIWQLHFGCPTLGKVSPIPSCGCGCGKHHHFAALACPPSHRVSHRRSMSSPAQAGLGFSLTKSHYQPLSQYQTKLNIYKAPGSRVHIFLQFVYSLEEQSPRAGLQPFADWCNTAPWVPVPICRSWQNAAGNAERAHGHWEIGRSES